MAEEKDTLYALISQEAPNRVQHNIYLPEPRKKGARGIYKYILGTQNGRKETQSVFFLRMIVIDNNDMLKLWNFAPWICRLGGIGANYHLHK